MTDVTAVSGVQGQLPFPAAPEPAGRRAALPGRTRQVMVLVDGHALAYRAYYALIRTNLRTRAGEPTGAVYGFVNMLLLALGKLQPDCLAVCFDLEAPTFRKEAYEAYKAQRRPMPDELKAQIDTIRTVVRAFGVPSYELAGFEADDVIATIALRAARKGFDVKILTGDRDIFQIVRPGISVLMPRTGVSDLEEYDERGVLERLGLKPEQVVDYKALAGDASDNIPGVKGIGEKTAVALLQEFGSLGALFADLGKVAKANLRELLLAHREEAELSYRLARIDTEAPVESIDWERCELRLPDIGTLTAVLGRLEFNSLIRDLPRRLGVFVPGAAEEQPDPAALAPLPDPADAPRPLAVAPVVVDTPEALDRVVRDLARAEIVAFDTETDGLSPLACGLVGISLAYGPADAGACTAVYIPLGHRAGRQLPRADVLAALRPFFEDPERPKVAHHAKFDVHVLSACGIAVQGLRDDTLVAAYVLDAGRPVGLKELARDCLGYRMTPISELIGKAGPRQRTMDTVAIAEAAPYAAADAAVTLELNSHLQGRLAGEDGLALYRDLEVPLIPVLWQMEQHGVRLDTALLRRLSVELEVRIREIERAARELVGHDFNLGSPKQLEAILFDKLQLPSGRKNKTGRSTDAAVLEELQHAHPLVGLLLEFRQLTKLKNTYLDVLPTFINARTGCVHTSYNQHVAATGRLSSDQPNLQNIPVRTDLGREIRRAFIPRRDGDLILSADYSQIELRILAHVARDEAFTQAFLADQDIHAATAAEIFGVPLGGVTGEMRRKAKAVNFGVAYGQTPFGLARSLGIPQKEARDFIDAYRRKYSGVHRYTVETVALAHRQGHVTTLLGRRRKLPGLRSGNRQERDFAERAAVNAPIQGSAADLIKLAMLRVDRALRAERLGTAMVLQVHDELVFEVPPEELDAAMALVKREMEGAMQLDVPLKVDLHSGPTWNEAK